MEFAKSTANEVYPLEFKRLKEFINSIKFGSVTIKIENGKILQMECTEKIRFDRQNS